MTTIPSALLHRLDDAGREALQRWLSEPSFAPLQPRLTYLIGAGLHDEVVDAFSRTLAVGTGGMRGPVGVGPNRFSHLVLGPAIRGHAAFLRQTHPERFGPGAEPPVLVLAYDVRRFHDLRGHYGGFVEPDPLCGISSRALARYAASLYAVAGFMVLLPEAHLVSTPELSFAIRAGDHLGGANLSASHNHPDDLGVKFYNDSGAQLSGTESDELERLIREAAERDPGPWPAPEPPGEALRPYPEAHRTAYLAEAIRDREPVSGGAVLYTPLEGVGIDSVAPALERACPGYHLQGGAGDGSFGSVVFGLPNPEIPAVFGPALAEAEACDATLVLASDPDADRLGAMARDRDGSWHFIDGNRIGSLLLDWICATWPGVTRGLVLIQTAVTAEETLSIARQYGLEAISDLPVGFKFIARAYDEMEARGKTVALAFEESHGYLVSGRLREKDAAGAAVVLAQAHAHLLQRGSSLLERSRALYAAHGHHAGATRGVVMYGPEGVALQEELLARLRRSGGLPGTGLTLQRDHQQQPCPLLDLSAPGDHSALQVLEFRGEVDGVPTRLCTRRSGTEPKIKLYVQIRDAHRHDLEETVFQCTRTFLSVVDQTYSRVCHALPDHIPLTRKHAFETRILPEALARGGLLTPELTGFLRYFGGGSLESLRAAMRLAAPAASDHLERLLQQCEAAGSGSP
jgi:phosphoglucomutase/phosphomannomutase